MTRNLRVLLAFDHEFSLGGTLDYSQNLFEPTRRLLDEADRLDVPITLFSDVCCVARFRDWDRAGVFEPFCDNLRNAIRRGHDVQLHLHPHWIDSTFEKGRFSPASSYTLSCFADRDYPHNISGIVQQGIELLNEICCQQDRRYRCVAFRAGGYALSPKTPCILKSLYDHGIRIESSIAKGNYFASNLWQVDHRQMPRSANWYISTEGPIDRAAGDGLFEIPIAARPRTPVNNLPFLFKRVLFKRRQYQSGGWPIDVGNTSLWDKLKRLAPHSAWLLGFDNFTDSAADLIKILQYHVDRHWHDSEIACSTVSHPKNMGDYGLQLMRGFINRARQQWGDQIEFCTYRQYFEDRLQPPKVAQALADRPGGRRSE